MATFTSAPVDVAMPPEQLFERLTDLTRLQDMMENLPAEARQQMGQVSFEKDTIRIVTPQVGEISFSVKERVAPSKVIFGTESSPVPLTLTALLEPVDGGEKTRVSVQTDVDVPIFLKGMISGPMQKATDQFATMLGRLGGAKPQE